MATHHGHLAVGSQVIRQVNLKLVGFCRLERYLVAYARHLAPVWPSAPHAAAAWVEGARAPLTGAPDHDPRRRRRGRVTPLAGFGLTEAENGDEPERFVGED